MTRLTYVWIAEEKIIHEFISDISIEIPEEIDNEFCVDTNFHPQNPQNRYGMWVVNRDTTGHKRTTWIHIPFEDFPIEFKTNLLLLGIE